MVINRAARQLRQRHPVAGEGEVAGVVGIADDGVGVGDIEIVTDQDHAEGRMEMVEKDRSRRRLSTGGIARKSVMRLLGPGSPPEVPPFSMNRMTRSLGLVIGCGGGAFDSTTSTSPSG